MQLRAVVIALLGVLPSGPSATAAELRPPNIVLFLTDDMGWSDWEHNGGPFGSTYYETPNMNRLAQEGVTFTNAYSAASTCSPTRHALMTGRSPVRSRMTSWLPGRSYESDLAEPDWNNRLAMADVTLPEALAASGYRTMIVGKWHLGLVGTSAADPLQHGFEVNFGGGHWGTPPTYFANRFGSYATTNLGNGTGQAGDYLTDELTDRAVEQIADLADRAEPFFLFMSHYAPHGPMRAPAPLVAKYDAKPASGNHDNAVYAAMLESLDTSLGRILDELELRGIRDDTLIVFTSDNGGNERFTSNAPLRGGKGRLYEGGTRVPLIMSWTGNANFDQGSRRTSSAITHDLYPTLLDLTGSVGDSQHNARVDGVSLDSVLELGDELEGPLFWHQPHIAPSAIAGRGGRYLSAVRSGDWKALYFYEEASWELYDLGADPGETMNRIATDPGMAHQLSAQLGYWLVATGAQLPVHRDTGKPVSTPMPAPEPAMAVQLGVAIAILAGFRRYGTRLEQRKRRGASR